MTKSVEATVAKENAVPGSPVGEWCIAGFLLFFFAFAYIAAQEWPFRAALFPQIVAAVGFVLTALRILGLVVETRRARRAPATAPAVAADADVVQAKGKISDVTLVDDEAEEDESMEYVFASAGGRAWVEALVGITVFFVSFFVLGAFITVPLFALVYLRFSGRASWLASAIYAAVTGLIIFFVFRELVFIPLPESVFPFLDF